MLNQLHQYTYWQILFVGIMMILGTVVLVGFGSVIAMGIYGEADVNMAMSGMAENNTQRMLLKIFQLLNQLGFFVIPPLVLAMLIQRKAPNFLGLQAFVNLQNLMTLVLMLVLSMPLIQFSLEWNQQLSLPDFLHGLETWIVEKEEFATEIVTQLLSVESFGAYLFNLLVLAVLPAFGEEFLFRGLLFRWLGKITKNIHLIIILSAILFSAFHLQFLGFLPRMLLGILLGYAYYWTRSLWASIILHFMNNALMVSIYFWFSSKSPEINPEEVGQFDSAWYLLPSLVGIFILSQRLHQKRISNI